MTDIVERSKQCPAVCDCDGEPCLLYELRAEIDRMRAAVKTQGAEIDRLCTKSLELHDDNARLRAALQAAETWLDAAYDDGPGRDAYDVVCRALEPKP